MRITEVIKESNKRDRDSKPLSFVEIEWKDKEEEESERLRAYNLYNKAVEELKNIAYAVSRKQSFGIENLKLIAKEFVDSLLSDHYLFIYSIHKEEKDWDLPVHSVDTAILAFKIAFGLMYERKTLNALVLTTFLHDLGMLTVPDRLKNKPGKFSPEEYEIIKKHPIETYNILKGLGGKFRLIAEIAYQEHEREDGSGYPRGLKGGEIHEFAKVIGLADIYGALIHPRPQRKRWLPFEAVKLIIAMFKGAFPLKIMKAMINELSAFPLGIYVKLNTKEIGKVIATNRHAPLRPTVEILFDSKGQPLKKPRYLDLSQHHLVNITETFFKEEI